MKYVLDKLVIPKNSGLEKCREYADKITLDTSKILEVRGEDVPLFVESINKEGKEAYGLTGEDLFLEFKLEKPESNLEIIEKISWEDPNAKFGKPTLCFLGPKGKN